MKLAIRSFIYALRKFKTATILNILGLSIAFASFIIIMMQVSYDFSFDKSIKDYKQIYRVEVNIDEGKKQCVMPRPFADIIFQSTPLIVSGSIISSVRYENLNIEKKGTIFRHKDMLAKIYTSYTDIFQFDMIEGKSVSIDEPNKLLLPESIARKLFGEEPAIGKKVELDDRTVYTVGGVYRDFPKNSSVKNAMYLKISDNENKNSWEHNNYEVYIKISSPNLPDQMTNEIKRYFKEYVTKVLNEEWDGEDINLHCTPLSELHFTNDVRYDNTPKANKQTVMVLFAIAFVIIIIASINFTNFNMALAPVRIRSINTQKVLGASNAELRRALIFEAILISIVAYTIALALIYIAGNTTIADFVDPHISIKDYPFIIAATGILVIITGTLTSIYPTYYITSFEPIMILKGNFGLTPKGRKLRNILIGIQFSASMILIITASFMFLQNRFMQSSPLGYDKNELVITDANIALRKSWKVFEDQLLSSPNIEAVAYSEALISSKDCFMGWVRNYKDKQITFQCLPVSPNFLQVMGIKITKGRDFRENDRSTRHGVLIFNERARIEYQLELNALVDSMEIVGFIPDIKFASFRTEVTPMAFFVWGEYVWGKKISDHGAYFTYIKANTNNGLQKVVQNIKKELNRIDSGYNYNIRFFDDILNKTYEKEKMVTSLITLFSLIAILISIAGVLGLVMFETGYRHKEISIRKTLGSSELQILELFNKTYIKILAVCFIVAVPVSYYIVSKWLENFAYKTPIHWWVFLISGAVILLIITITVSWQSWRAANANPVDALKNE